MQNRAQPGGNQMIQTIAVDPDYRGQGIGSSLLQAIEKRSIQKPAASHRADLFTGSRAFYEKTAMLIVHRGVSACRRSLVQHDQAFAQPTTFPWLAFQLFQSLTAACHWTK